VPSLDALRNHQCNMNDSPAHQVSTRHAPGDGIAPADVQAALFQLKRTWRMVLLLSTVQFQEVFRLADDLSKQHNVQEWASEF